MARNIALFAHLIGVALLFVAIGTTQLGGSRLRRSTTVQEAQLWVQVVERSSRWFGPAFLVILGAGMYLAQVTWGFDRPFIVMGIVTVVVMAAVGGAVVGRSFAGIGRALEEGARDGDVAALVGRPGLWAANGALEGMSVGIIWDMVAKPDWAEAIGVVAGVAIAGAILGSLMARRSAGIQSR